MKTINAVEQAWLVIIELMQRHLHTSTGNGRFALLGNACTQVFRQIVSIRVKTVIKKNEIASRHIKRLKISLRVDIDVYVAVDAVMKIPASITVGQFKHLSVCTVSYYEASSLGLLQASAVYFVELRF